MGKDLIKRILRESDFDWTDEAESPLKIGDPVKPIKNPKNTLIVKIEWMSGDADAFNKEKYKFKLDKPKQYRQFILLMKAIKWMNSYGTRTDGRYGTLVPGIFCPVVEIIS